MLVCFFAFDPHVPRLHRLPRLLPIPFEFLDSLPSTPFAKAVFPFLLSWRILPTMLSQPLSLDPLEQSPVSPSHTLIPIHIPTTSLTPIPHLYIHTHLTKKYLYPRMIWPKPHLPTRPAKPSHSSKSQAKRSSQRTIRGINKQQKSLTKIQPLTLYPSIHQSIHLNQ